LDFFWKKLRVTKIATKKIERWGSVPETEPGKGGVAGASFPIWEMEAAAREFWPKVSQGNLFVIYTWHWGEHNLLPLCCTAPITKIAAAIQEMGWSGGFGRMVRVK